MQHDGQAPDQDGADEGGPVPPERDLVLASVPRAARAAIATVFALDDRLAGIVRTTREPMVGQMRLAWWHDALERLDTAPAPAEPLLRATQAMLLPHGVTGALLATMTDGWEELIVADPLDDAALARHADSRGRTLFLAAGAVLVPDIAKPAAALSAAGQGWALADLSRHLSRPDAADRAAAQARLRLSDAFSDAWPRQIRGIGLLALLARLSLDHGGALAKAITVTRFRLTGR